ncbi:MAG: sodium:calcium antiporter [Chloroflexi bacterium]|nr:sodium:calcium antiporter [Chloroflexota bacterium]
MTPPPTLHASSSARDGAKGVPPSESTVDRRPSTVHSYLPTASCLLPPASCQLPTAPGPPLAEGLGSPGRSGGVLVGVIFLVLSLAAILLAAELFTNALEWFGRRAHLAEGLVGSVLAAVGTALPETLIPIVAVLAGSGLGHGQEVGIGAILGAPFMLSTLAMFVTGASIFAFRRRRRSGLALEVNQRVLARDVSFFLLAYSLGIAGAFLPLRAAKLALAAILLGLYGWYVSLHAREVAPLQHAEELDPLHFARAERVPGLPIVLCQAFAALALIVGGAYFFVQNVSIVAEGLGVPALVLALIVAPVATELPEKFNSVLWVSRNRDTLALGNITGAMVFQSCVPVSFGLVFTEWSPAALGASGMASAAIALVSTVVLFGVVANLGKLSGPALLSGGAWYLGYLALLALLPL